MTPSLIDFILRALENGVPLGINITKTPGIIEPMLEVHELHEAQ
jgi:hypothetical protein